MSLTVLDKAGLILDGRPLSGSYADLYAAIKTVAVKETITGASTCTLTIEDPKRILTRSGLIAAKVTVVVDGAGFELVAARKNGNEVELDFEDMAVAALRRHRDYRKVAAGTMSRVAFCQLLIREESWIKVNAAPGALAKVELARGSANSTATGQEATGVTGGIGNYGLDPTAGTVGKITTAASTTKKKAVTAKDRKIAAGVENPEDTWAASGRIMGEIGWRVSAVRKVITIAPDSWILSRGTAYLLSDTSPGVESIDWDYDTGKPAATAQIKVRCGTTTSFGVGSRVTLTGEGPADGDWLVETIERTDRSNEASVDLIRPQPVLAEPETTSALLANSGEGGYPIGDYGLDSGVTGTPSTSAKAEAFVTLALQQRGKPYVWGASGPNSFDCSGLVQWCFDQVTARTDSGGLPVARDAHDRRGDFPKPVGSQLAICRSAGTLLTVQQALATRGALLIRGPNEHIAISLGNGRTMEARGRAYGCNVFDAVGRNWTTGAYAPGIGVAVTNGRDGSRGD